MAWFALKYPYLVSGGIASSASVNLYPVKNVDQAEVFWDNVWYSFKTYGGNNCDRHLKLALEQLKTFDVKGLQSIFNTCETLDSEHADSWMKKLVW